MNLVELPKHLLENKQRLFSLRRWATMTSGRIALPVYLCGSALIECNINPRDWDLRVEMPDDEFAFQFGDVDAWIREGSSGDWTSVRWKWSNECVKQTRHAWRETGLNVDFQIYPVKWCKSVKYHRLPKARLDTHPDY